MHWLSQRRVLESQFLRVQQQPWCGSAGFFVGVEGISKNREADGLHVHPQLMRTAGYRGQQKQAGFAVAGEFLPTSE